MARVIGVETMPSKTTQTWSTEILAVTEQDDGWADIASSPSAVRAIQSPYAKPACYAEMRSSELTGVMIRRISVGSVAVGRTLRLSQQSESGPYYRLYFQTSGAVALSQEGRTLTMKSGDLALYGGAGPYHFTFDGPYSHVVVLIPCQRLRTRRDKVEKITAVAHRTDSGVERLLAESIQQVELHGEALTAPQMYAAMSCIVSLLDATLESWLGHSHDDGQAFLVALSYVDEHLQDLDLTPAAVAASQFVSVRSLQAMFARHGLTPGGWIRQRRLEMCRRDLIATSARSRTITEIANSWGFLNSAHFSHAFKDTYGISPREARLSMAPLAQPDEMLPQPSSASR
jgi:AraC-like DNA-binding protein